MGSSDVQFLRPVEPEALVRDWGHGLLFAAVPRNFTSRPAVASFKVQDGAIRFVTPQQGGNLPQQLAQTAKVNTAKPDLTPPKTAGRALFAATEARVYAIFSGADGDTDGGVWYYSIPDASWEHVAFTGPAVELGAILGVALEPRSGRLIVVDEVSSGKSPSVGKDARFTMFDVATGKRTVMHSVPRSGAFERVAVVATGEGDFALVSQRVGGAAWTALRFTVSVHEELTWTGQASGPGTWIDDPFTTSHGVVVPVDGKAGLEFSAVEFRPLSVAPGKVAATL